MTRLGLTASASSPRIPDRSSVPGADDSIHTSEIFQSAIKSSTPGILEVQIHGEPVLGDVRLVEAVFARAAG
jgi:hypothetical protein